MRVYVRTSKNTGVSFGVSAFGLCMLVLGGIFAVLMLLAAFAALVS